MSAGGAAFSASVYLDDQQLVCFPGIYSVADVKLAGKLPVLKTESKHLITVIQDHMSKTIDPVEIYTRYMTN